MRAITVEQWLKRDRLTVYLTSDSSDRQSMIRRCEVVFPATPYDGKGVFKLWYGWGEVKAVDCEHIVYVSDADYELEFAT